MMDGCKTISAHQYTTSIATQITKDGILTGLNPNFTATVATSIKSKKDNG